MSKYKHPGAKHAKSSKRLRDDVGWEEVLVRVGSEALQQGRRHNSRGDDSKDEKEQGYN